MNYRAWETVVQIPLITSLGMSNSISTCGHAHIMANILKTLKYITNKNNLDDVSNGRMLDVGVFLLIRQ